MLRIVDCLTLEHDLALVLVAAGLCAVGALSTVIVAGRITGGQQHTGKWLVVLGVCLGSTVWSTHFISMLAYQTSVAMTYDPVVTALSFFIGAVVMGLGFSIASRGESRSRTRLIGGTTVGSGASLLHYVGMAAVSAPGTITYDADLVVASVVAATVFGAGAAWVVFGPARAHNRTVGALLLVVMTVTLHFTAMGAARLTLGPTAEEAAVGISRSVLAGAVTVASLTVLLIGIVGAIVDQRVSHRLATEAERYRALAEGAFEGLLVHHQGVVTDANAAARRMLGLGDDLSRHSVEPWLGLLESADLGPSQVQTGPEMYELVLYRDDGSSFPAEVCRRRMLLPDGRDGELLAIRDLSVRKEFEDRIAHLALHDALTDLPNRWFFVELANKHIAQAQRSGSSFALLMLDLDGFKIINDMHGHGGGDDLLRIVASRIGATPRNADVVARLGGDEFAVLQTSTDQPTQAMRLVERISSALREPVRLEHAEVHISASIGIALYPRDGATVEALVRNADTALYRAKAEGKATCRFFEAEMDMALNARRRLEGRLRRAILEERLTVAYQPIVDCHTYRPLGFEALARWNDEELGVVSPAEFIPVAEESGLINPLGEFILRRACTDAASWPGSLRVAVNLSAAQFRREGLVDAVRSALAKSGLPGDRLELEVTENLLIENRDEALRVLNELKALGARISMDDFGTGYSSLSYLKSFPFDKIKIDQIFISDLDDGTNDASIVRAMTSMGRSLQMRVVAEGVESEEQAAVMRELDCDELQGFLIAAPMAIDQVKDYLSQVESPSPPRRAVGRG
jgi:diguanylate cyclase (GGDEF)-like protein